MPKLDEKLDAILEAIFGLDWRGWRQGVGPRAARGVGGRGRFKNLEHAVHLQEAGGGGFNGASPVPLASQIEISGSKILVRRLVFG